MGDGTQDTVMKIVRQSSAEGLSNDETAARLRQFRAFQTTGRAERVARTEMTAAANQGSVESFKQADIEMKAWYAALDGRERPSHAAAHGQIRKAGELFEVGSDRMEAPGQGSSARENVNCRCVVLPVEDEEAAKELRDQIGTAPEAPEGAPKLPEAETLDDWLPELGRGDRKVNAKALVATQRALQQTARSLKPELARKMKTLFTDPNKRMRVVMARNQQLTRGRDRAAGVYSHFGDRAYVAQKEAFWAAHHEFGHQLTIESRLVEWIGKKKATAFMDDVQKVWFKVERQGRTAITKYSTKNVREFMAENFKYAITNPDHLKAVDPEMLGIMRRYFLNSKFVPIEPVPGYTGTAALPKGLELGYTKPLPRSMDSWASAYKTREELAWPITTSPK